MVYEQAGVLHTVKTVMMWVGVVGAFAWGWERLRHRAPGPVKLLYWIGFLLLLHITSTAR